MSRAQKGPEGMQVTASARYVRISPSKVRQVALLIRGRPLDEARRILAFTPKTGAREISKVLESAVANAEHNFQIPQDELLVKLTRADEGPTLKRYRPRALGRAYRIRKRTSHIHVVLAREPKVETVPAAAGGRPGRRRRSPAVEKEKG
ncbi:MAG: 50S ribosomal protein L22 [Actinomycetota bacterium]